MGDASEWSTGPGGVGAPPPAPVPDWAAGPPPASPVADQAAIAPAPTPPASTAPAEPRPAPPRTTVATLAPLVRTVVVGGVALAGAQASRLLPDWDEGRWWLLTAALVVIAVGCGVLGVGLGVSALGEVSRHRRVVKGGAASAACLVLATGLVLAGGVRGAHDWDDLDVPAAWDRLELGKTDGRTIADSIDDARGVTAASGEDVRTRGRTDGCYEGDDAEPGAEVRCSRPHGMEVLGQITMRGAPDFPGDEALRLSGAEQCRPALRERVGEEAAGRHDLRALVPDEVSWLAGDRTALCVVVFPDPVEGRIGA